MRSVPLLPVLTVTLLAGCLAGAYALADAPYTLTGNTLERFGFVVRGVGDINGDGDEDFVATSPNTNTNKVYVFFGPIGPGSVTSASASAIITGPSSSETGWAVAGPGDVSGDGVDDLVIGAPSASSAKGQVYVFRGPLASTRYSYLSAGTILTGVTANDILGTAVDVGDYNGDGVDDLLVGAPYATAGGLSKAGKTYLVKGPIATGSRSISAAAALTFEGAQTNAYTGWSVAFGGNMDASGGEELVIGAPRYSYVWGATGTAYVIWSGLANGTYGLENAALDIARIRGDRQAAELGWAVAGGGDITADGYDDIVLGAPSYACVKANDGGTGAGCASDYGTVHLFEGGARVAGDPPLLGDYLASSDDSYTVTGTTSYSGLGNTLAVVGDLDADGADDVLIGSLENKAYLFYGGGWSGQSFDDTQAHAIFTGENATDWAGIGVGGGDLDGDGYADLLVGAPGQKHYADGPQPVAGKVYAYFGEP